MNDKETVVYYHAECMDGFAAAAVCFSHLPNARFIPVNYNRLPTLPSGISRVFFVDITPTQDWVLENILPGIHLVILDHHVSAEKDLSEIKHLPHQPPFIRFNKELSGVGLAWQYFNHAEEQLPVALNLIQQRDLWRLDEKERKFHELFVTYLKEGDGAEIFPPFLVMVNDFEKNREAYETVANYLILSRDQNVAFFLKKAVVKECVLQFLDNQPAVKIAYVNAPRFYISEVASQYLNLHPDVDLVVNMTINNGGTGLSFRSRTGTGFARAVAECFGGGGHADAAGGVFDGPLSYDTLNARISVGLGEINRRTGSVIEMRVRPAVDSYTPAKLYDAYPELDTLENTVAFEHVETLSFFPWPDSTLVVGRLRMKDGWESIAFAKPLNSERYTYEQGVVTAAKELVNNCFGYLSVRGHVTGHLTQNDELFAHYAKDYE